MHKKAVSVIMPTYNRGYIIGSALESLRKQNFKNFEVIVVDDGSTDNTEEVVRGFRDLDVTYIKLEQNRGANHARNLGIQKAQGKYLAFLDSDNEWKSTNLSVKITIMQSVDEQVGFVFGSFYCVCGDKSELHVPTDVDTQENLKKTMLLRNVVDTNTVLVKRECFEEVGGFDEGLRRLQDWDMFSRILFEGEYKAVFCQEPLVINKIQADSITMNNTLYLEARNRILSKRWEDYKKVYKVDTILESYLFERQEWEGISICDRIKALQIFEIQKEEWDQFWSRKTAQIEQSKVADRNWPVLKNWILLEEKEKTIVQWFEEQGISKIGIYGYGYLGKHLLHELLVSDKTVEFIVDKNVNVTHKSIPVYHKVTVLPEVDVIVVTAAAAYEEIKKELGKTAMARVISLNEIIDEILF